MKNTFLLISICAISFASFAQGSEWTKDDRTNIYNEYLDALTKYKNITQEQKKSIALECLKVVTNKYPKKDYYNLIDAELERIQKGTINTAAANIDVPLGEAKSKEEPKNESNAFRVEDFSGMWTSDVGEYSFMAKDGTYNCKSSTSRGCMNDRGDYHIEGRRLTIQSTRSFCGWSGGVFTIITVSPDEIVLNNKYDNREVHLKKIK